MVFTIGGHTNAAESADRPPPPGNNHVYKPLTTKPRKHHRLIQQLDPVELKKFTPRNSLPRFDSRQADDEQTLLTTSFNSNVS